MSTGDDDEYAIFVRGGGSRFPLSLTLGIAALVIIFLGAAVAAMRSGLRRGARVPRR